MTHCGADAPSLRPFAVLGALAIGSAGPSSDVAALIASSRSVAARTYSSDSSQPIHSPAELLRDGQRRAAAGERVEHKSPGLLLTRMMRPKKLLGHLAAVKALPFLERAGHAGVVPRVVRRLKAFRQILRPQHPGVVRQPARAGFARLSPYTSARAEGTRTCGSSALNVKLFSSFTK